MKEAVIKRKERVNDDMAFDAIRLRNDDDDAAFNASRSSDGWPVLSLRNPPPSAGADSPLDDFEPIRAAEEEASDEGRYFIQVKRIMNIAPASPMNTVQKTVAKPNEVMGIGGYSGFGMHPYAFSLQA